MLGITLSGGGARGMAHIGVLKALEEHAIFPEYISGASAGSIIGALYAAGKSPDQMLKIAKDQSLFKAIRPNIFGTGLANLNYLRQILEENIREDSFDALKKKLYVCVSNLNSGEYEIITSGSLFDAVVASSSIPIVFEPVDMLGSRYVDGGLLNNLPIEPIKENCEITIGVNVMPSGHVPAEEVNSMLEIGIRTFDLVIWSNAKSRMEQCDFIIEPKGVFDHGVFDFGNAERIVELGYEEARRVVPSILERIL